MSLATTPHQYIDRRNNRVVSERPIADRAINFLYHRLRENSPAMFRALTSARISQLLGFWQYDLPGRGGGGLALFSRCGADWRECLEPPESYNTPRKFFERQIRYWEARPMDRHPEAVVSPADSRVLIGSFTAASALFIKESLFDLPELLGPTGRWPAHFANGDFAVFRLTPDKYHYNHLPVSGRVVTTYTIDGRYHSCNPTAQIALASLYSKNRRMVTIINTDVPGGSAVGMVAMVEIVALMIGDIVQCYSEKAYAEPRQIQPGMFVEKGAPKSLFRPGSSTDVLIFQPGKIAFAEDLIRNSQRQDVQSRFSQGFKRPLVETDVAVRSTIAWSQTVSLPAPLEGEKP
jgi:phosphatidylserine decarboxylase